MKRILILVAGLVLVATNTWAATYSVTSTPGQETALTAVVAEENATRAALDARDLGKDGLPVNPRPPLTNEQYIRRQVKNMLNGYIEQQTAKTHTTIREAWEKANDATRAKVRTDLGLQ